MVMRQDGPALGQAFYKLEVYNERNVRMASTHERISAQKGITGVNDARLVSVLKIRVKYAYNRIRVKYADPSEWVMEPPHTLLDGTGSLHHNDETVCCIDSCD
jgi:hypothetical protein